MSGKTFDDLEKEYYYFEEPYLSVKVNGTDLVVKEEIDIQNSSVILTSGYESNICRVDIIDNYSHIDDDVLKLSDDVKEVKIGDKIEIYMGYSNAKGENSSQCVFSGSIIEFRMGIDETFKVKYHIESMDEKVFMMGNLHSRQLSEIDEEKSKYSQAISTILKEYQDFGLANPKVTETEDINVSIEQHNKSDYEFIVDIAKNLNYLFFISYDEEGQATPNFISYKECQECILEATPDNHIINLDVGAAIVGQLEEVIVHNEQDNGEVIEGQATASNTPTIGSGEKIGSQLSKSYAAVSKKYIVDNGATSPEAANARALAEATRASLNLVNGEIVMDGVPMLQAGKLIELKGFGEFLDKKYFISQVEHVFDTDNSYKTICSLRGNRL